MVRDEAGIEARAGDRVTVHTWGRDYFGTVVRVGRTRARIRIRLTRRFDERWFSAERFRVVPACIKHRDCRAHPELGRACYEAGHA